MDGAMNEDVSAIDLNPAGITSSEVRTGKRSPLQEIWLCNDSLSVNLFMYLETESVTLFVI